MKWVNVVLLAGALVAADMIADGPVVMNAEARVGRPATPVSVAGVARRTTRRVIRRTAVYAATLPAGCQTVLIEGTTLYQCGGTYYQASGSQYEVVQVQ
jgi:hypothetical protein